jgi:hypothetical protein
LIHGLINAPAEVRHGVPAAPQPEGGAPLGESMARPLLMVCRPMTRLVRLPPYRPRHDGMKRQGHSAATGAVGA